MSCSSFLRQLKLHENKIRRIELQSRESRTKNESVKLLFEFSPCKSNESRAVSFLEQKQVVTRRDKEDLVEQREPSVERWTAEAAQWSKQKTCVLS